MPVRGEAGSLELSGSELSDQAADLRLFAEHRGEPPTGCTVTWRRQAPLFIPGGATVRCALHLAFVVLRAGDSAYYDVTPFVDRVRAHGRLAMASGRS